MSVNDSIKVEKGKVKFLTIFEVTEEELFLLEKGTNSSIFLNLAIACLTSGISSSIVFFINLSNPNLTTIALGLIFGVMLFGIFGGLVSLFIWKKNKTNIKIILNKIRERIEESKIEFHDT